MAILKNKVKVTVHDSVTGGSVIHEDDQLRIDFDIRTIPEFNRGTITLYNLNDKTIRAIQENRNFITLEVETQYGTTEVLAERFLISNTVDEIILPNRLLTLYCFDQTRLKLENPVHITVPRPSLKNKVLGIMRAVDLGQQVEFKSFPRGVVDFMPPRPSATIQGESAQKCLRDLEKEFNFKTYNDKDVFTFMYLPDVDNVSHTDLATKDADVILDTNYMRANPKIGPATAAITSLLDTRIKPTSVLDLSQLLTVGVNATQDQLELAAGFNNIVAGFQKYQAFAVQHKGSNYTKEWTTIVSALSPTKGQLMPTTASSWAHQTNR